LDGAPVPPRGTAKLWNPEFGETSWNDRLAGMRRGRYATTNRVACHRTGDDAEENTNGAPNGRATLFHGPVHLASDGHEKGHVPRQDVARSSNELW
jgi:hypothetical protein